MTSIVNGFLDEVVGDVGSRTKASVLAQMIRRDIIQGVFPPSSRLKPRELAQRYEVGTVPLREALSRLVMSGFVEAEDQRGFRVAGVSIDELIDLTGTRQEVESTALRLAILNGDLSWETGVLAAFHRLEHTPRNDQTSGSINSEWEIAHDAYHTALLAGCGSAWLIKICNLLRDQTDRYRQLSVTVETPAGRNVLKEHAEITDAVMARDVERANLILKKHFDLTTKLALEKIRSRINK